MTTQSRRNLLLACALALLTALAYLSALHAGFVWDDDAHITENWNLRSAEGLARLWFDRAATPQYYPLTHSVWWLEYQCWGIWPAGYHAVNVLVHIGNALLLWKLLDRLRVPGAWFASLLFAVHPLQVETVAWIMELKNLLSCLFYLLAFHAFLGFLYPAKARSRKEAGRTGPLRYYLLGLLLFVLALLSKSVAATLPAALLLVIAWQHHHIRRQDWLHMLPLFFLSAISGTYTAFLERTQVGASGAEFAFGPVDRFLIAGRAFWAYLAKLAYPWPQMLFYPRWSIDAAAAGQYLFPGMFLIVVAILWYKRKMWGAGPLTAMLFFAGTLAPALGFINVYPMRYSFVADHFQYMACIGPFALLAAACAYAATRWRWAHRPMVAAQVLAVLALLVLSNARGLAFRDRYTLYADLVEKNPTSWAGHALLASEQLKLKNLPEAVAQYREATRYGPAIIENWEGLGSALLQNGQVDEARKVLTDVVQKDPSRAVSYNDLAAVYIVMHQPAEAARLYQEAIQRQPTLPEAHFNLAELYANSGQNTLAAPEYRAALNIRPEWPEAAFDLACCYAEMGQLREAKRYFELALQFHPGWPEAQGDLDRVNDLIAHGNGR